MSNNKLIITINCFVSPSNIIRQQAEKIIGIENFIGVFINSNLETCEKRDTKGLYKKARSGEIKDFTGVSAPFESPLLPEIEIKTENKSVEESVDKLFQFIKTKVSLNQ